MCAKLKRTPFACGTNAKFLFGFDFAAAMAELEYIMEEKKYLPGFAPKDCARVLALAKEQGKALSADFAALALRLEEGFWQNCEEADEEDLFEALVEPLLAAFSAREEFQVVNDLELYFQLHDRVLAEQGLLDWE